MYICEDCFFAFEWRFAHRFRHLAFQLLHPGFITHLLHGSLDCCTSLWSPFRSPCWSCRCLDRKAVNLSSICRKRIIYYRKINVLKSISVGSLTKPICFHQCWGNGRTVCCSMFWICFDIRAVMLLSPTSGYQSLYDWEKYHGAANLGNCILGIDLLSSITHS